MSNTTTAKEPLRLVYAAYTTTRLHDDDTPHEDCTLRASLGPFPTLEDCDAIAVRIEDCGIDCPLFFPTAAGWFLAWCFKHVDSYLAQLDGLKIYEAIRQVQDDHPGLFELLWSQRPNA
jgi:hypothetical protein